MPTYVDPNACNACQGVHEGPLCVYICPNDLMVLDASLQKGAPKPTASVPPSSPKSTWKTAPR